ncbi:hypothetical protein ACH5RR_017788 [Cinchona calisaya]|uniref:SPRY domain-containing protein n=1 Tax=Cinchona calisaya TaxID=153742 RepID=A0ABD2ZKA9_9GENT
MASSTKRHRPMDEVSGPSSASRDSKKGKFEAVEDDEGKPSSNPPVLPVRRVVLNPADCDLDFNIEGDGLRGSALYERGFAYCWSGARANVGINGGKYCFGCKIIAPQPVDMDDTPMDQQNVCRVGISRGDDGVGNLGETSHSFGFGGTGKFSNAGKFIGYGEKFGVGDTIICCVDLESKPMASIGFSKNGKWLGVAMQFDAGPSGLAVVNCPIKRLQWQSSLFPHILLKNVEVQMQFSTEDGLVPQEGYKPWTSAIEDSKVILGPTFQNISDCEVRMMIGLPASGKSTWAENLIKAHPEKRYILLGTNLALDQMKVPGLLRKHNYGERFDCLMERATGIFNTLLSRASKLPRNFIIDQTNVYKNARKRKLKPFASYRKIAVVVFPKPEELKDRADKRFKEMGKEVPAEAVNEMLANYTLPMSKDMPGTDEYFDEVYFPELSRAESQKYLDLMKADLNVNRVISPHSGKGVVQSYDSPSLNYHKTSNTIYGAPMQNYRGSSCETTFPSYGAPLQNQGSLPDHMGVAGPWSNSYLPQPSVGAPANSYCPNFSLYPVDNLESYGSHGGYFRSGRSDGENRFASPGVVNELDRSFGAGYTYSATDNNRLHMTEAYAGMTRFPFGSQDVYASQPQGPPQGPPQELFSTGPPTFGSTAAPYGSSYGTPTLPRPSYGNFPPSREHLGGYGPPRPW